MNASRSPDPSPLRQRRDAGFSLIELLVSMAIGLIVTLAIASVLISSESAKRSSTSVNDMNQNGAFVGYALDRALRNAGSGLTQRWNDSFGCRIGAALGGPGAAATIPKPVAASKLRQFQLRRAPRPGGDRSRCRQPGQRR